MQYTICETLAPDTQEMRKAFTETLMELAQDNPDIVLMDADLMVALGSLPFAKRFPQQTVDCGIQEANMVGVAAGLSATGKIPFAHSFATFVSRRAFDQTYISGAYAKLNVKLIGTDPGITAGINGGTHQSYEDMGILRSIPNMTLLEPADCVMARDLTRQIAGIYGMHYMRIYRKPMSAIYREGSSFEIGKAVLLREGTDLTIVASGICVAEAMKAACLLAEQGISAKLLNVFTWKPIDEEAIAAAAAQTGAVVTAENHNVINGLGSAVCETLARRVPAPVEMVGIQDHFGEVGPVDYLLKEFRLSAEDIVQASLRAVARKSRS